MSQESNSQKIGISTATIVGMNAMIGAGIFTAPAALTSNVGPAGILAYAFVIVAVWFMALSIARVASLYPGEGSFYYYASRWGGHIAGVVSAGAYLLGLLIAMGLLSQVAGLYLNYWIEGVSSQTLGISILLALIVLNMIGLKLSEFGQIALIFFTVSPIVITTFICFAHANINNLIPFAPYGFTNVIAATKAVIFGFFGFEAAASLYPIVKNPKTNVPKALTYSIVLVGVLYLAFVASIIAAIPLSSFTNLEIRIDKLLLVKFPHYSWLIFGINISILSAVLGTLHSMIWSSSALLLSFLSQFKKGSGNVITKITTSPYKNQIAVLIIGAFILFNSLVLNNLDLFFSLTAICLLVAYGTTMITLLIKDTSTKDKVITILGLATASIIFYFAIQEILQQFGAL